MPLTLIRTVDATVEPISVSQAKAHCRVTDSNDDALFAIYIMAARQYAEKQMNRAILQQTWRLSLDAFPWYGPGANRPGRQNNAYVFAQDYFSRGLTILLPRPNLIAVQSVTYLDSFGVRQTISPTQYVVDTDSQPARIVPTPGINWPYPEIYQPNTVQITYTAGYGPDPTYVPATVQLALLMLVAHFYENREASSQGVNISTVPMAVDALLANEAFTAFTYEA